MSTALIIGASRGIGHELARQYLQHGWRVIATARSSDDCDALTALGAETQQLDVTSAADCAALGCRLDGEQLDVALLNAGIYGPRNDGIPLEHDFDQVMHTNVLAAMRLLPIIAPMVCAVRGKLAVTSSMMGSLSLRHRPNAPLYRASKAALNSVLIDTALIFGPQGATCVAFHPGWVRTTMGGADADLSPEQSAQGMRNTLAGLASSEQAAFLNYDGKPLSW
ncbi:MAG: NAD(P)-dependent dehydrogenase (short-subunit alcohol dehydrogenase family) [Janthinobacterium sp.]|jgi:NAD(P)-dependent dehydrogenase (short-subunit alcohol dehydrogenase family)